MGMGVCFFLDMFPARCIMLPMRERRDLFLLASEPAMLAVPSSSLRSSGIMLSATSDGRRLGVGDTVGQRVFSFLRERR